MISLVVLPGLDGTATLHDRFLEYASPHFDTVRVLAYPTDRLLDYTALEAWVRERLPDRLPFLLLGESFAGPLAIAIAASPPAMLRGLVLSTSFAQSPVPALTALAPLIARMPLPMPPTRWLLPLLLGRWATPSLATRLKAALATVPTTVLRFRAAKALRADASAHLTRIVLPVLYLRATHDRLLARACAEQVHLALPHSIVHEVPGPHLLLQAAPDECARIIAGFAAHC